MMGQITNISWCDHTFNPWIGCTKVGPACDGCYAEALMSTEGRMKRVTWGKPCQRATHSRTSEEYWKQPLKWNREAAEALEAWKSVPGALVGPPTRFVFCASLADVFDKDIPTAWRRALFDLIHATPHLTWLLLTKRPQNIVKQLDQAYGHDNLAAKRGARAGNWPQNAAIGFTAVTQPEMDRDSRHALAAHRAVMAAFLFWSGEPFLEPVLIPTELLSLGKRFWAITGGETDQGKFKARISHPGWFRGPRDQCAAAGAPYHHKQNGEWQARPEIIDAHGPSFAALGDVWMQKVGKKAAGRLLDGVEHNARPQVSA